MSRTQENQEKEATSTPYAGGQSCNNNAGQRNKLLESTRDAGCGDAKPKQGSEFRHSRLYRTVEHEYGSCQVFGKTRGNLLV